MGFGPDQYAAFYGGEITAHEGEPTTWVHNITDKASDLNIHYEPNNKYLNLFCEYLSKEAELFNGQVLHGVPDFHSNLDTLSSLINPENLCIELYDNPDAVEDKLNILNEAYPAVYEKIYKAANLDRLGTIGWHPIYCEGKTAIVQCDFVR